jgi:4-diphosphocytidyl-2-C-methyl-D-erythritol kinase
MDDGFHRLETLFQAVSLEDTVTVEAAPDRGVDFTCRNGNVGPPAGNLVVRAAEAFRAATGATGGLRIRLDKRIPVGAGLGGGSSDAGATLRALNQLHGFPLGPDELGRIGVGLGADVPFFTGKAGYALGEGRGERLTPLPPLPPRTVILGLPRVHVATGPAYGALARKRAEGASAPSGPVFERGLPADWDGVIASAVNDFEAVVPEASPPVAEALGSLRKAGAPLALLSGSGGAVFGLPWGPDSAACLASLRASAPGVRWEAVETLAALPEPEEVVPGGAIE